MSSLLRLFNCLTPILVSALTYADHVATDITHISSLDHWKANDTEGYYRFITRCKGSEHMRCRLQLESISYPQDGIEASRIITSQYLDELIDESHYAFSTPSCLDEQCNTLSLNTVETFTFEKKTYRIILLGPGQYKLTASSK